MDAPEGKGNPRSPRNARAVILMYNICICKPCQFICDAVSRIDTFVEFHP